MTFFLQRHFNTLHCTNKILHDISNNNNNNNNNNRYIFQVISDDKKRHQNSTSTFCDSPNSHHYNSPCRNIMRRLKSVTFFMLIKLEFVVEANFTTFTNDVI